MSLESELASERTSNTMLKQQRAGRRMSYLPPYGQMIDPKDPTKLIVNADEQRAIQRMIELRKEGTSFRAIARQLKEEGFKPRYTRREFKGRMVNINGRWRGDFVARIIRREEGVGPKIS
ncbi:MAG: hypothetical protein FVQ82_15880 [Planctomycetes bacterium]|nr:hypothetical protein [Planctomycetota bacterium]